MAGAVQEGTVCRGRGRSRGPARERSNRPREKGRTRTSGWEREKKNKKKQLGAKIRLLSFMELLNMEENKDLRGNNKTFDLEWIRSVCRERL